MQPKEGQITNLKMKNNQKWQKIKLYGSLTTKELKKKHSSRLLGKAEMDSWAERAPGKVTGGQGKVAAGGASSPTFVCG